MEYAKRKYPRLKQYDYSLPGYYYVTIHAEGNAGQFSRIIPGSSEERPAIQLTSVGHTVQEQLLGLEIRYDYVQIDKYVIMPTHIHAIIRLLEGKMPRTDIPGIVGAYKSLTTIAVNKQQKTPGKKRFQTLFYDTVLRNERAYQECWKYIDGNPDKWIFTELESKANGGGKPPPYIG